MLLPLEHRDDESDNESDEQSEEQQADLNATAWPKHDPDDDALRASRTAGHAQTRDTPARTSGDKSLYARGSGVAASAEI
jgi:hypothetical protein